MAMLWHGGCVFAASRPCDSRWFGPRLSAVRMRLMPYRGVVSRFCPLIFFDRYRVVVPRKIARFSTTGDRGTDSSRLSDVDRWLPVARGRDACHSVVPSPGRDLWPRIPRWLSPPLRVCSQELPINISVSRRLLSDRCRLVFSDDPASRALSPLSPVVIERGV